MKYYVLLVFIWCGLCPCRAQDTFTFYPSSSQFGQTHTQVTRQIQHETYQPIRRKDQFANEAGSVALLNSDPVMQIIRQIIGPEAIIQSLSYGNNQQNSFPVSQGYSFTFGKGNPASDIQQAQRSSQFQNILEGQTTNQNQVLSNSYHDIERYTVLQKDEQNSSPQNENSSPIPQIPEPTNPTKKPLYLNRFAADLYITKKPCEMCCKEGDVKPCTRCCDVIPLLNEKTLKIITG